MEKELERLEVYFRRDGKLIIKARYIKTKEGRHYPLEAVDIEKVEDLPEDAVIKLEEYFATRVRNAESELELQESHVQQLLELVKS